MKTNVVSFFLALFLSFGLISCNNQSPVTPEAVTNSLSRNENQNTDGSGDAGQSFRIDYLLVQSYTRTPVNDKTGGGGTSEPFSRIIAEGFTYVGAQGIFTWHYQPVLFTPNAVFTEGGYEYNPYDNIIEVHTKYTYSQFCGGVGYSVRNKLYLGSTEITTHGDFVMPCIQPTGGYFPPLTPSDSYTISGTSQHELRLGIFVNAGGQE